MTRVSLLLLGLALAFGATAHDGCFAPPQLVILRIAQQAQLARQAKAEEERYWEAALSAAADRPARDAVQAALAASRGEGARHCEAFVAPHAGTPMDSAYQWQCEAEWSRRAARRAWEDFLRGRVNEPPEPPPPQ